MVQLIGVIVDSSGSVGGFLTWDLFSPEELIEIMRKTQLSPCGFLSESKIEVVRDLRMLIDYPYFYEAFVEFAQDKIPHNQMEEWVVMKKGRIGSGRDIYFLGIKDTE